MEANVSVWNKNTKAVWNWYAWLRVYNTKLIQWEKNKINVNIYDRWILKGMNEGQVRIGPSDNSIDEINDKMFWSENST